MKTLLVILFLILPVFANAGALAVRAGDIFIINNGDSGVYQIDSISGQAHRLAFFNVPTDLALSPDGYLYISEFSGKIQRFNLADGTVNVINPLTTLWNVNGLVLGPDGNLFVTCASSNSVVRINPATGSETVISQGNLLFIPIGLDFLDKDHLAVASYFGNRIVNVALSDGSQSTVIQGKGIDRPWGLAVRDGNIYVAAKDSKLLQKISGQQVTNVITLADPIFGIGTETNGNILVGALLDVNRVSPSGVLLRQFPGAFNQITAVEVAGKDLLSLIPAKTTGLLNCTPNPSKPGTTTTLNFNVNVEFPYSGTAQGTAVLKVHDVQTNWLTLTNGGAVWVITNLALGSYDVWAEYAGDNTYAGVTNTLPARLLVNTPPQTGPDLITRNASNETQVSIPGLLANDSAGDDGDEVSFVWVEPRSAQGATLYRTNDWIIYTTTNRTPVTDSFTYAIKDTLGVTNSGLVTVNPSPESIPAMKMNWKKQGRTELVLQFNGVPSAIYSIEYATNLISPTWITLTTTNADALGQVGIVVTNGSPQCYYRSGYR